MTALAHPDGTTEPGPDFTRRLNLWLAKFSKAATANAYADDLGIPHEARDWYTASAPGTPGRRGRRRGEFRRGAAFFPWCARHRLDPLVDVGLEQLQHWLRDAAATGLAKSTRARMLTSVREFYVAMQRQGVRTGNPAELVDARAAGLTGRGEDDEQLELDAVQVRQLLALARAATPARRGAAFVARDLAVVELLAVTGARADELCSLDLRDYRRPHPAAAATLVLHGKGGKTRTAQIEAAVADDVDAWLHHRAAMLGRAAPAVAGQTSAGRQPLLCTRTGGRLSSGYLGNILQRLAAADGSPLAGIAAELHPHALRAAFVTLCLDAGVPIEEVAAAAGHAHISTTLGYDRRRKRRRTGAFRAVSGLLVVDPVTAALAADDARQIDGQTSVPLHTSE